MKRFLIILVLLGSLALFVYVGYFLYQKDQEAPVVFKTSQPALRDIYLKTVANGSIEPRREVELKPQISGIIDELYVEAGEHVKKGQKIAKIKLIPSDVTLNSAESNVTKAKLAMEQAKLEYDRRVQLYDAQAISSQELAQFKFSYEQSVEDYNNAKNNLQLIKDGVSSKSKQTTTIITSTISGMVLDVPVKEGTQVIESNNFNDGTTVATVADMNDLIFVGKVDESEVGKIKEGMPLNITIGAIEAKKFHALLEYISPKGVEDNGTIQFEIKAALTQPDSLFIRAGYSANADIILDKREQVLTIMERDITSNKDSTYIEVEVEEQKFEKRTLETGLSDGVFVEVLSGVKEEDKIKTLN